MLVCTKDILQSINAGGGIGMVSSNDNILSFIKSSSPIPQVGTIMSYRTFLVLKVYQQPNRKQ